MRKFAIVAAAVLAASLATPALAVQPVPQNIGGCSASLGLPTPDAQACNGYWDQNVLSNTAVDIAAQQTAVTALGGTFDGNFAALPTGSLTGDQLSFGTVLAGLTIIGAHFGNIAGDAGEVTIFWRWDNLSPTSYITLDNTQGWSNAVLYTTGTPNVPEPATWALMLFGFGAAGVAMRRQRGKNVAVAQFA
jgi:hypothetical protein